MPQNGLVDAPTRLEDSFVQLWADKVGVSAFVCPFPEWAKEAEIWREVPMRDGVYGMYKPVGKRVTVRYFSDADPEWVRYSFMHELSHHLVETDWVRYQKDKLYRLRIEVKVWTQATELYKLATGRDVSHILEVRRTLCIKSYQRW